MKGMGRSAVLPAESGLGLWVSGSLRGGPSRRYLERERRARRARHARHARTGDEQPGDAQARHTVEARSNLHPACVPRWLAARQCGAWSKTLSQGSIIDRRQGYISHPTLPPCRSLPACPSLPYVPMCLLVVLPSPIVMGVYGVPYVHRGMPLLRYGCSLVRSTRPGLLVYPTHMLRDAWM